MAGRYAPLENYLRGLPEDQMKITLGFAQIERILKATLPASAYEDQRWWLKETEANHVSARSWDKCRLEGRECGCQPAASEDDSNQVRPASIIEAQILARCAVGARQRGVLDRVFRGELQSDPSAV